MNTPTTGLSRARIALWKPVLLAALMAIVGALGCKPAAGERMSYLDNGTIRLGVDLDVGGAITYLSKSGTTENLVNNADRGRQIQMSHYSGPVPYAPPGVESSQAWVGLGWNPIQVGDCFGHPSRILAHRNDGKSIYVKCIPMQWPLNNVPGECTFECWITLAGSTAQVRSRMVNDRPDRTQYAGRGQELPAVYTNGPWYRLMTYDGAEPFTGGALRQMPAKMPWSGWQATENWAALVNDDGWGLGIWHPGAYQFIGGFAGTPGKGGPKDGPTGYIAPLQEEIIDHNIDYEYRYVLILGSTDEIRRYVYSHAPRPAPPVFRFQKDRRHWHYADATDAGWPIAGELNVRLDGAHPQIIGPLGFWEAAKARRLTVQAAFHTVGKQATVYWSRADADGFAEARSARFTVIPDGAFHTYRIDLGVSPEYRGGITRLRLDPEPDGHPGDTVRVRSIGFE